MVKPTLLVLAAGMGSRFGGLKQLEPVGPSGETLLDYAVYDAVQAGFGRVCFVIRASFREDFERVVLSRLPRDLPVDLVFQEMDTLPAGCTANEERTKPWGTGHAVLVAQAQVAEPFAVINADDYYGREAYRQAAQFLAQSPSGKWPLGFSLVAFELGKTLSDHGSVSRGICEVDENELLVKVTEHTRIVPDEGAALSQEAEGGPARLELDTPTSMNFFAFQPGVFPFLEEQFRQFLAARGRELRSEFYLPAAIASMVRRGQAKVQVLRSREQWMGVTYADDRASVVGKLQRLAETGYYPSPLWQE